VDVTKRACQAMEALNGLFVARYPRQPPCEATVRQISVDNSVSWYHYVSAVRDFLPCNGFLWETLFIFCEYRESTVQQIPTTVLRNPLSGIPGSIGVSIDDRSEEFGDRQNKGRKEHPRLASAELFTLPGFPAKLLYLNHLRPIVAIL